MLNRTAKPPKWYKSAPIRSCPDKSMQRYQSKTKGQRDNCAKQQNVFSSDLQRGFCPWHQSRDSFLLSDGYIVFHFKMGFSLFSSQFMSGAMWGSGCWRMLSHDINFRKVSFMKAQEQLVHFHFLIKLTSSVEKRGAAKSWDQQFTKDSFLHVSFRVRDVWRPTLQNRVKGFKNHGRV